MYIIGLGGLCVTCDNRQVLAFIKLNLVSRKWMPSTPLWRLEKERQSLKPQSPIHISNNCQDQIDSKHCILFDCPKEVRKQLTNNRFRKIELICKQKLLQNRVVKIYFLSIDSGDYLIYNHQSTCIASLSNIVTNT